MLSLIPLATSFGEFEPAVIERICEYFIDGASDKRFAPLYVVSCVFAFPNPYPQFQ